MAVPTGEYELTASVDLSPVFGVIEKKTTVTVTRPPSDILDVRLKELEGGEPKARLRALYDLRFFPTEGERIVPQLVGILKGEDEKLRSAAISVFGAFPKEAAGHMDLFVKIMNGSGAVNERGGAAWLVARFAPNDAKYEKAFALAMESTEGYLQRRFEGARDYYRRRHTLPQDQ